MRHAIIAHKIRRTVDTIWQQIAILFSRAHLKWIKKDCISHGNNCARCSEQTRFSHCDVAYYMKKTQHQLSGSLTEPALVKWFSFCANYYYFVLPLLKVSGAKINFKCKTNWIATRENSFIVYGQLM